MYILLPSPSCTLSFRIVYLLHAYAGTMKFTCEEGGIAGGKLRRRAGALAAGIEGAKAYEEEEAKRRERRRNISEEEKLKVCMKYL